jgi:hypothetical protein
MANSDLLHQLLPTLADHLLTMLTAAGAVLFHSYNRRRRRRRRV